MATGKSVWGIDIGQCALKALKLREVNGQFQAEAFDVIEHPKILSQPDADSDQLVQTALEQFMARNNVSGSKLVVSVPGQSSFTRFIKLPPVDPKRIPEIVKFEAEQQIPFPINDVIWRWQTFQKEDSPDVELGIFAMKKVDVQDALGFFDNVNLKVDAVQMVPLALCNFMFMDGQIAPDGATLLADVGVDKTDLVVIDGSRLWIRTINLGGSAFTEALVRAFKLPFKKAEKLKRSAASSKYARQIFQAMRPVFADLVQEIQRSIGFYTQLHRETRFKKLIGLGNGFRLPGLQKFLEQNLNLSVTRIDSYNNLRTSDAINAPAFDENVLSFAVAYGLAVQGLGSAAVDTNLLPDEVTRKRLWASKRPWFAAAAAMLVAGLGLSAYSAMGQLSTLEDGAQDRDAASRTIQRHEQVGRQYRGLNPDSSGERTQLAMSLLGYQRFWPTAETLISSSMDKIASHQNLYRQAMALQQQMMFLDQESAQYEKLEATLGQVRQTLQNVPRGRRQVLLISSMQSEYIDDMSKVDEDFLSSKAQQYLTGQVTRQRQYEEPMGPPEDEFGGGLDATEVTEEKAKKRGMLVVVKGRTPAEPGFARNMLTMLRRVSLQQAGSAPPDILGMDQNGFAFTLDTQRLWQQGMQNGRPGRTNYGDYEENDFGPGPMGGGYVPPPAGGLTPGGQTPGQAQVPYILDPAFPNVQTENAYTDTGFVAVWALTIEGDGVPETQFADPRNSGSN